jgi:CheY-like chemotaxis protein
VSGRTGPGRELTIAPSAQPIRHVLVIDDDQATRQLYRDLLNDAGYRVTLLRQPPADPTEALAHAPDLILIDLIFAGEEAGLSFIRSIKHDPQTGHLPVLVSTAASRLVAETEQEISALSCQVILKPFDLDQLLEAIERCIAEAGPRVATG